MDKVLFENAERLLHLGDRPLSQTIVHDSAAQGLGRARLRVDVFAHLSCMHPPGQSTLAVWQDHLRRARRAR